MVIIVGMGFWDISKWCYSVDSSLGKMNIQKLIYSLCFVCLISFLSTSNLTAQSLFQYPETKKVPFDTVIFDVTLSDPYAWLSLPEFETDMLELARQQTALTNQLLDSLPGDEIILSHINRLFSTPSENIVLKAVQGHDLFYMKSNIDGKRGLFRRVDSLVSEELMLSLPLVIEERQYTIKKMAFGFHQPLVAMMIVESGDENPHIRFYNLSTRTLLIDRIGPVMFNDASGVSMAWLPDDSGLLYSQAPPSNSEEEKYTRGKIKLHHLGEDQRMDQAIFGFDVQSNLSFQIDDTPYIYTFPFSPFVIARIRAGQGENYAFSIHLDKLDGRNTPWVPLQDYSCNHGSFTVNGHMLYGIQVGGQSTQLVRVDLETGATPEIILANQKQIFAEGPDDPAIISGQDVLYIKHTSPGKQGILKLDFMDFVPSEIQLPFDCSVGEFLVCNNTDLIFVTTNWTRDFSYFSSTDGSNQVKPVFGNSKNLNSDYLSKVIYVPSRDHVQIPVSLVYKQAKADSTHTRPVLLEAYGCFGSSMDPFYNPEQFVWLETGGIYAIAHVRGGGELGASWAAAGSFPHKMTSIYDLEDVAEYLVENKYTTGHQQAISGSSCGTLHVGLATLHRPDLFCAGVYLVGIPDLVTNRGVSFGRGQNEFGPLDTKEGFLSRLDLSAYYHIVPEQSSPAMLIVNGATDYIVPIHNAARYVTRLQQEQKSHRPSLFMVDWQNGHQGAGSSQADLIRKWKFLMWQTGHPDFQPK